MNWKIEGLKKLDSLIGGIASSLSRVFISPRAKIQDNSGRVKILVIRPGGIGDAALLYPALRELRVRFPDARIDVLAEKRNSGILRGCPYIHNVIIYDATPLRTLLQVINSGYDIAIDTEQWHRLSAVVAYLTRAPVRAGFAANNERMKLLSHPVAYSHDEYEASSFLNLVSAITGEKCDFDENEPFIPPDAAVSKMRETLAEFGRGRRIVGIFPGATVAERRWGVAKFAEVSRGLIASGMAVALLGGGDEMKYAAEFEEMVQSGGAINFIGKTSLAETAALISRLDLLVTADTGLLHIACGVGTPTVSLFGAGIKAKWAPKGQKHVAINKNLPCSPCTKFGYTPPCPYNVRCLAEITVEEVLNAAAKLLP